jgi:hypothetical protein
LTEQSANDPLSTVRGESAPGCVGASVMKRCGLLVNVQEQQGIAP